MIGPRLIALTLIAAPAVAGMPTGLFPPPPRAVEQVVRVAVPAVEAEARIVEMQAYRRSGVVSAWLSNGIRVHHRRMTVQPGQIEVMISMAGGELLECAETRGLSMLCASYFDHAHAEAERLRGRDVHIEGGAMSDALLVRVWGSAADIGTGLEIAAGSLGSPRVTPELLEIARASACESVERTQTDARWSVTEPLLELVTPVGECRNKLACTKKLSGFTAEQVAGWISRHADTCPCEVAVVGDISANDALRMVSGAFGSFPERRRAAPAAMAEQRCVGKQQGPFTKAVDCRGDAGIEEAHVLAGFLSPDPSEVQEVRRLRAGARVLSERLENRLRELKLGGDPHVSWTYMPSPFAGRSVTVVAARVTPGDAEPVKQLMQASMCELMDHGLPAEELARSTEKLARVAAAYERDPRYWAAILARSASTGLDPELIADGPEVYRAMRPDEVLAAMRRACTIENRLDLVVRPGQP